MIHCNVNNTYYILVDKINVDFPGFSKLIVKIKEVFTNVRIINSLNESSKGDIILPLGIVSANYFLSKYSKGQIAFIIDSSTLCFSSVTRFYLKRKDYFNPELLGSILRYVKYYFIERKVIRRFEKVIVVSENDANYLRKKFSCKNIEVVTNGADFIDGDRLIVRQFEYKIGILSYWGAARNLDVDWFIRDYYPRLKVDFPFLRLIVAGRGADDETISYFKNNDVVFIGEVNNLCDFFNQIDIYITTVRKECGVLNKVLDAMAHRKIVVGLEHNMSSFRELKNGFFTYRDYSDLVRIIKQVRDDRDLVNLKIDNAYNYLIINHDWINNYSKLKVLVDAMYCLK